MANGTNRTSGIERVQRDAKRGTTSLSTNNSTFLSIHLFPSFISFFCISCFARNAGDCNMSTPAKKVSPDTEAHGDFACRQLISSLSPSLHTSLSLSLSVFFSFTLTVTSFQPQPYVFFLYLFSKRFLNACTMIEVETRRAKTRLILRYILLGSFLIGKLR